MSNQHLSLVLVNGQDIAKEINFVFDNCGGQNKNRMVLRFMIMLAKLKMARVVRAIFLIKGHTKNDCDRMFNLLKYDWSALIGIRKSTLFKWRLMRTFLTLMYSKTSL